MYWGEEWVPLRQARRALARYLGDPASKTYSRDARRAGKDRAQAVAQAVLGQLDNPAATPDARRELLAAVTDAAYTGEPDLDRLERAPSATSSSRGAARSAGPSATRRRL